MLGENQMNKSLAVLLASAVLSAGALAQSSVNSQTDVSASENSSASANRDGVNAQSNTSAQASQQTSVSQTDRDYREQHPSMNRPSEDRGSGGQHPSNHPAKDRDNSQGGTSSNGSLTNGSTMQAVLTKPVDARRCKEGDQVFARTTNDVKSDGKVVIPKGSKLVGHVTQAKASSKDSAESTLGITFDKAMMKDGQEVPMHTVIQAVASAQNTTATDLGNDSMMSQTSGAMAGTASSGGLLRGVSSGVGATAGTVTNATAGLGGTVNSTTSMAGSLNGKLTPSSNGVIGMPGLNLTSDMSNTTQGTLFTCKDHSVRLASGTQMVLKVVGE
jgi:hypothetical protein